jgi:hypothetical protein
MRVRACFPDDAMFAELDTTVVLDRDLPEHGLCRGDRGAVVQVYPPEGIEVEFVRASGRTQALCTLSTRDVCAVDDRDLIAVRPLLRSSAARNRGGSILAAGADSGLLGLHSDPTSALA